MADKSTEKDDPKETEKTKAKVKKETFRVRGTVEPKPDGGAEVILHERDSQHPGGEVFIAGKDEAEVFPTPRVTALIREGKLVEV